MGAALQFGATPRARSRRNSGILKVARQHLPSHGGRNIQLKKTEKDLSNENHMQLNLLATAFVSVQA